MSNGFTKHTLEEVDPDAIELISDGMPVVFDSTSLAFTLGIRHKTLWWLVVTNTYKAQMCGKGMYREIKIPKRSGKGVRTLHEPCEALKHVQESLLEHFLTPLDVPDYLGAYVPGRDLLHTVKQHTGKEFLISVDIQDFFPSITRHRVETWFRSKGYSPKIANLLGGLTTVPLPRRNPVSGRAPYKYVLPQGAPTSPALANHVICDTFDEPFVKWLTDRFPSGTYTRYSDNLEISFERGMSPQDVQQVLVALDEHLAKNNLRRNLKKTRLRGPRNQAPMRVLGVSVQEHANVPKRKYRYLRGLVHRVWTEGLEHLLERDDIDAVDLEHAVQKVRGQIQYWSNVNPPKMRAVVAKWEDCELVYASQHKED